jgi:hypothetical protein
VYTLAFSGGTGGSSDMRAAACREPFIRGSGKSLWNRKTRSPAFVAEGKARKCFCSPNDGRSEFFTESSSFEGGTRSVAWFALKLACPIVPRPAEPCCCDFTRARKENGNQCLNV